MKLVDVSEFLNGLLYLDGSRAGEGVGSHDLTRGYEGRK